MLGHKQEASSAARRGQQEVKVVGANFLLEVLKSYENRFRRLHGHKYRKMLIYYHIENVGYQENRSGIRLTPTTTIPFFPI